MKTLLRLLLKSKVTCRGSSSQSEQGFTMIELLVGAIVAFLIIGPILGFVVNILNDDKREGAKASTEQELQAALDYIKSDLNQAVYIYDQAGINTLASQTNSIFPTDQGNPVLVFLKRKFIENGVDVPGCETSSTEDCQDDTHVFSLVAYYLEQRNTQAWCASGSNCPAQITRFEIQDGARNPTNGNYICGDDGTEGCENEPIRKRDTGFPTSIDPTNLTNLSRPDSEALQGNPEVLMSYVDASTDNAPSTVNCADTLGITTFPDDNRNFTSKADAENATLSRGKIGDNSPNSFYACIDTFANTAQVFVRANSLRRIQEQANYAEGQSVYFPTGSVQVRGISRFGD